MFESTYLREELPCKAIRYHKILIKEDLWGNYSWSKSRVVISGILTWQLFLILRASLPHFQSFF